MGAVEIALGIGVPVATGLSFLAYSHPGRYAKIGRAMFFGSAALTGYIAIYLMGIWTGVELYREKSPMIVNGYYSLYGANPVWAVIVLGGITAFLWVLTMLRHLKDGK